MRALAWVGDGRIAEVDVDVPALREGTVRIVPRFTGICGTDLSVWHGTHSRATAPVILGHEFSGVIDAVGSESRLMPGARVVVQPVISCGQCAHCLTGDDNICASMGLIGIDADGSLAEFVVVEEKRVHVLPDSVSLEAGAFVEPLAVVCHLLRRAGGVRRGMNVFIAGAGPIGFLAAALARARGAQVTLAEPNEFRAAAAREAGFTVVDRGSAMAELAIEASGTAPGFATCVEAAASHGVVAVVGLAKRSVEVDPNVLIARELTLVGSRIYVSADIDEAIALIADGTIRPEDFISRVVPFAHAVTEGFDFLDNDGTAIKVLIEGVGA